jgi:hypothetical protein
MDMCGSSPESKLVLAEPFSTSRKFEDMKTTRGHVAILTWRKDMGAVLRIWNVNPGYKFFHPGSKGQKASGSRIRVCITEFKYF